MIGGGGTAGLKNDVIAQFKDNKWSLYGNLHKGRSVHGSITFGDKTMVIGGNVDNS